MIIVEITNSWVKAIWGKSLLKDIQINGVVTRSLQSDSDEEIYKAISSILDKDIFKRYHPVILCISRSQTTLRNLKFPSRDEKELDNIINLHLTQQVPYSREEIVFNYAILDKAASGFAKILLGIMHRELLRRQFSIFERLDMHPENIQLSSSGLMNFLHRAKIFKDGDNELNACLDIDSDFSDFIIFKGGNILFSKSIALGVNQLAQPDKLSKLIGEMKQALIVFQTEEGRESPKKAYLTGATPEGVNVESEITAKLQLAAERIDPVNVFASLKEIKSLPEITKRLSVSALLGIATKPLSRKLNFVLPEAKLKKDVRETARNLVIMGSIVFYLLVLVFSALIGKVYSRQIYLDRLTAETRILEGRNSDVIQALDKLKTIKNFTKPKKSFLYYYYELAKIVPANITVDRMIFSKLFSKS